MRFSNYKVRKWGKNLEHLLEPQRRKGHKGPAKKKNITIPFAFFVIFAINLYYLSAELILSYKPSFLYHSFLCEIASNYAYNNS